MDKKITLSEFINNVDEIKQENKRLKEQLKILKEDIKAVYDEMIALEIIDKHDDIEEI